MSKLGYKIVMIIIGIVAAFIYFYDLFKNENTTVIAFISMIALVILQTILIKKYGKGKIN